jgi:hypothetical protein
MTALRRVILSALRVIWVTTMLLPVLVTSGSLALARERITHASAGATGAKVQMQVDAGYSSNFRSGAWLPLRVRIANAGPGFAGTLLVDDSGQQAVNATPIDHAVYARTVVLPAGGEKDLTIFVPGADLASSLDVILEGGPGGPLVRRVGIAGVSNSTLLVGVLSQTDAMRTELRGLDHALGGAQLLTVPLRAQTLDPQPLALASLDAIIIENFSSADLSSDQIASLDDWVRRGGVLVEIGGPTATATVAGLTPSLVLLHPGQPRIMHSLPGLSGTTAQALQGTIVAATGAVMQGRTVLATSGVPTLASSGSATATPLVVQQSLGLGAVVYSAIDPALEPVASWQDLDSFWTLLLAPARATGATLTAAPASASPADGQGPTLTGELDAIAPPSLLTFLILLGGYVLILVPLNFVILKAIRRVDWAWLTLPATALLVLAITFGTSTFGHGSALKATVVSVLYNTTGGPTADTVQYVGLLSPASGDYTTVPGSAALLGSSLYSATSATTSTAAPGAADLKFNQDTGAATMVAVQQWSARNAAFSGNVATVATVQGSLQFQQNGHLTGTLTNRSPYAIHDLVLAVYGASLVALGDLPAQGTLHVDVGSGASGPSQQSLGDAYSTIAAVLDSDASRVATASARAQQGKAMAAALVEPVSHAGSMLAANSDTLPTAPGETEGERLQRLAQILFSNTTPALFGSPVLFGWIATPLVPYAVNGGQIARMDTDLLVQTIPVSASRGDFTIQPGTLPARLSGASQDVQPGDIADSISIAPNSEAFFLANLPLPARPAMHPHLTSLTLSVFSSGSQGTLSSTSVALFDWRTGHWDGVDASSGQVTVHNPDRFVNAAGAIRVRLQAQDSSISLASAGGGIALGATGAAQ